MVLDILHPEQTGHWEGTPSAAALLVALSFDAVNLRSDEPRQPNRDRSALSKHHAYRMLDTGPAPPYIPVGELSTFCQFNSRLEGQGRP